MSAVCEIALAFGIALEACAAETPIDVPVEDPHVWDYQVPAEPPPPPIPEQVIVKEIIEVPVPVPVPTPQPTPEPPLPEPDKGFDVAAVDHLYSLRRAGGLTTLIASTIVAEFTKSGEVSESTTRSPAPLATPARYIHPGLAGGEPVDNSRILAEDRYITGILETSINTQLDGSVIIQTSRDIFGYHGRRILLPKGSRMVCDYTSPKKIGEHRIGLVCDRILTAGYRAEIFQVAAPVGDVQGRAGITGDVDNRFLESYGSAFILTFISASVRAAVASSSDSGSDDTDDVVITEAGEEISTRFGEITASVLQRTLNLKPIVTVPQGTRVQIRPASDWYIKPTGGN